MPINHHHCVVVAGDEKYFARFGQYLVASCEKTKNRVHCHIINPGNGTKQLIKDASPLTITSYSMESLDFDGVHPLAQKTYFYFSRYFVARHLLKHFAISKTYITDMDMIFLKTISLPGDKKIGVAYDPKQPNDWKRSMASFVYVDREASWFLDNLISSYITVINDTDFLEVEKLQGFERACKVGLDQVCLSREVAKITDDDIFLNLRDVKNLTSKSKNADAVVWHLLRDKKDPKFDEIMLETMEE